MYKIIVDSCGELTEEQKKDEHFCNVAFDLEVDGEIIHDDETFDQLDFLRKVKASVKGARSACPSPERFMEKIKGDAERIYVVTISSKLSGAHNSAVLAASLYHEENEKKKKIHVFDSRSASVGETLIALKIDECEKAGMSFEEVVETTEKYIDTMHTFFVLETLEVLRKAGRLSNMKSIVASTLNIKPVMSTTPEGAITQLGKARGMKKALDKMVEEMIARTKDHEHRVLAISHCNCPERAELVKKCVEDLARFKKIIILDTAGVSSMYAYDGGVIMVV